MTGCALCREKPTDHRCCSKPVTYWTIAFIQCASFPVPVAPNYCFEHDVAYDKACPRCRLDSGDTVLHPMP